MRSRSQGYRACQACQKRHVSCDWTTINPIKDGAPCIRCAKLKLECSGPLGTPTSCRACRKCHHRCVSIPGSPSCERCTRLGLHSCREDKALLDTSRPYPRSSISSSSSEPGNDSFIPSGSILVSRTTSEALSRNGQQRLYAIGLALPKLLGDVFGIYVTGNKSAEAAVMMLCMVGFKLNNAVEHAGSSRILPIDDVSVSSWLDGRLPKTESQRGNCDHLESRVAHILKDAASSTIASKDLARLLSVFRLFLKFKCNRGPLDSHFREVLTALLLETVVHLDDSSDRNEVEISELRASAIQIAAQEAEASITAGKPSLIAQQVYERLMPPDFESYLYQTDLLPRHEVTDPPMDPSQIPVLCYIVRALLDVCGRDVLRIQRRLTGCWAHTHSSMDILSACLAQAFIVCSIMDSLKQSLHEANRLGTDRPEEQDEINRTSRSVCCIEVCLVHVLVIAIMVGQRLANAEPSLSESITQPYDLDQWRMQVVLRLNRIISGQDRSTSLADYFHVLDMITLAVRPDPSLWSVMLHSSSPSERIALIQTLSAASFWDPSVGAIVNVLANPKFEG